MVGRIDRRRGESEGARRKKEREKKEKRERGAEKNEIWVFNPEFIVFGKF